MSILAEQIAAVKIEIVAMENCGYDDFADSPEAKRFAAMRSVLATLEGTAAPGKTPKAEPRCICFDGGGIWDNRCPSCNSPSPQQPTKEDLDVARKLLANIRFVDDDEDPDPAIELIAAALQSERSAATDKARRALEESVKLQSHYAALLNDYDGGKRLTFASADEWIARLEKIAALTPQNPGAATPESEPPPHRTPAMPPRRDHDPRRATPPR
jgi:hypothetical protein